MRSRIVALAVGALAPLVLVTSSANAEEPWDTIQPIYTTVKCSVTAAQQGQSIFWRCFHPGP